MSDSSLFTGHGRPRLNLVQLTTLVELVRRGTLTAAADALGYTAGAASQHVSALEKDLGVQLTERLGRQLRLTQAGRALAEHAELLLDAEESAVKAARATAEGRWGRLVVGAWGSSAAALLPPIVSRLAETHPSVRLHSKEIDVDSAMDCIRHGDVDIAFGLDYADAPMAREHGLEIVPLLEEEFVVTIAGDLWRRRRRRASTAELADLDWILPPERSHFGRSFRFACRRLGFEPRVVHEVTDTAASLQLAAAGAGAAPMTGLMERLGASDGLVRLHTPQPITREIILVARESVVDRDLTDAFVGSGRDALRNMRSG